jgi:hypothetical protein
MSHQQPQTAAPQTSMQAEWQQEMVRASTPAERLEGQRRDFDRQYDAARKKLRTASDHEILEAISTLAAVSADEQASGKRTPAEQIFANHVHRMHEMMKGEAQNRGLIPPETPDFSTWECPPDAMCAAPASESPLASPHVMAKEKKKREHQKFMMDQLPIIVVATGSWMGYRRGKTPMWALGGGTAAMLGLYAFFTAKDPMTGSKWNIPYMDFVQGVLAMNLSGRKR